MIPVLAQAVTDIATPRVDWGGLSPLLILLGGSMVLVLVASFTAARPPRWFHAAVTVVTGLLALGASAVVWSRVMDDGPFATVAGAVVIDGFAVFFFVTVSSAVVLAALLSEDYVRREGLEGPELYILMLLSASGGLVMASANDLIVFFLGFEILSIALYVLAGFHVRRAASREASLKYFVLGAFSSAFLIYGIAFVYGATGTTNLAGIADFLAENVLESRRLLVAGFAFMLVGLGFKTATVPFHSWTPDVYQGAPTPITSFMASASKAAAFAGLLRIFVTTFGSLRLDWQPVIWVLAIATLAVGAFFAIVQSDVKRMLAYSSINHAGFVLVGVHAVSARGTSASLFYLLSYTFMVIGSFAVVTVVGRKGDGHHDISNYRGLSRQRPALALAFTVLLLAQAGVPFTAGFLAKFYVIGAAVDGGDYALALIAMATSVVAAFLYLRIIVAMYMGEDDTAGVPRVLPVPTGAALAIGLAIAFTLVVGVLPGAVIDFARDAVPVLISAGG